MNCKIVTPTEFTLLIFLLVTYDIAKIQKNEGRKKIHFILINTEKPILRLMHCYYLKFKTWCAFKK